MFNMFFNSGFVLLTIISFSVIVFIFVRSAVISNRLYLFTIHSAIVVIGIVTLTFLNFNSQKIYSFCDFDDETAEICNKYNQLNKTQIKATYYQLTYDFDRAEYYFQKLSSKELDQIRDIYNATDIGH